MSSKIKIYKGAVTAGQTDGTLVSSGTGLDPIESGAIKVPAAGYQEGSWIKLAVRCDTGYETVEDSSRHARISIVDSAKVTMWQLAPDNSGQPGTAGGTDGTLVSSGTGLDPIESGAIKVPAAGYQEGSWINLLYVAILATKPLRIPPAMRESVL
jgi:hypothetical protein